MSEDKDSEQEDAAGLPDLTEKQMNFVMGFLSGKSAADAYREAYDTQNMQNNSIWCEASRLLSHPKISLWLEHAKSLSLVDVQCTRDAHLRELERLKGLSLENNNMVAAINCEHLRGKVAGHYIERHENVTPKDPIRTLNEIAKLNPALALDLANKHNIAWKPKETVH